MYKYIFSISLLFFACESSTSSGQDNSINFIGSTFNYDVTANSNFQKKPIASLHNDTVVIADYWAMIQQPTMQATAEVKGDSIIVQYSSVFGVTKDWTPTVVTLLRFTSKSVPQIIILKINAASTTFARAPDSLELAKGFRDARQPFIKVISRDSL